MSAYTQFDPSPPRAFVHVFVRGHWAGPYEFATLDDAEEDATERRRKFGVLGCGYVVSDSPEDPRD